MAIPTDRTTFKEYVLRRLGAPVIKINVADAQIDDRIDDALQYWNENHMDGLAETYYKYKITAQDKTNKYITLPAQIQNVMAIIPLQDKSHYATMFDIQYQMRMNDIFDLNFAGNMSQYVQTQQFVSLMNTVLNGRDLWRHHRAAGKLYIDADWDTELHVDHYIILKTTVALDPTQNVLIWNDQWFKAYCTALVKRQWGEILSKHAGVAMLGGVTFSGAEIFSAANTDIEKLEEEMKSKWTLPPDFIVA